MRTYRPRHDPWIADWPVNDRVHGWMWAYALVCSCGRQGPRRASRAEAQADQDAHQDAIPEITQPDLFDNDDLAV